MARASLDLESCPDAQPLHSMPALALPVSPTFDRDDIPNTPVASPVASPAYSEGGNQSGVATPPVLGSTTLTPVSTFSKELLDLVDKTSDNDLSTLIDDALFERAKNKVGTTAAATATATDEEKKPVELSERAKSRLKELEDEIQFCKDAVSADGTSSRVRSDLNALLGSQRVPGRSKQSSFNVL